MSGAAEVRIARARGEADAARARLLATLDTLKARVAPGRIASDAVQSAKDKGQMVADETVAKVRDNPGLAAGIAALAAVVIARKPLLAAARALTSGSDDNDDDMAPPARRRRREGEDHGQEQ